MSILKNITFLTLLLIFFGCEESKNKETDSGKIDDTYASTQEVPMVRDMVSGYILLKDAFVATDYEAAKSAAVTFKQVVSGNIDAGFEKALIAVTDKIIQAQNVEEQRVQFEEVSILMYALAGNGQFEGQRIYKQFCPMAFDNKGAYWLSLEENVLNPYFGDRMLKCGYVEEVL